MRIQWCRRARWLGRSGARLIVGGEAAIDDGARHRRAARAAEVALAAEQYQAPAGRLGRQAAVEAGDAQAAFFGRMSVRMPSAYAVLTAAASIFAGRRKLRSRRP